jgi:hypothetical protein
MHRHVKIAAIIAIVAVFGFIAGRYVMISQDARYDADHP